MRVLLTLPIREVRPATARSRIVRIGLEGTPFRYRPGHAVLVATHGYEYRRPYSIAAAPEDARQDDCLELLIGIECPEIILPKRTPLLGFRPRPLLGLDRHILRSDTATPWQ